MKPDGKSWEEFLLSNCRNNEEKKTLNYSIEFLLRDLLRKKKCYVGGLSL
jgi:hypothetical protein